MVICNNFVPNGKVTRLSSSGCYGYLKSKARSCKSSSARLLKGSTARASLPKAQCRLVAVSPLQFPNLQEGEGSGAKKEPKPKLFGADIFRWGRGLSREGVGAKTSLGKGNQTFWAGYPGVLPGYPGGGRKVWEKRVCVQFSSPKGVPSGGVNTGRYGKIVFF